MSCFSPDIEPFEDARFSEKTWRDRAKHEMDGKLKAVQQRLPVSARATRFCYLVYSNGPDFLKKKIQECRKDMEYPRMTGLQEVQTLQNSHQNDLKRFGSAPRSTTGTRQATVRRYEHDAILWRELRWRRDHQTIKQNERLEQVAAGQRALER